VLLVFDHHKWTKKEISNLAKFMPKHNRGPTPNVTKDNAFTGSCKIIIGTKKIEIIKLRNATT
jgi:serine/threonine-protein kinase RIO1